MQIDPYRFHGDWTQEEKQTVLDILFAHTPRKVDALSYYNLWHFYKAKSGQKIYIAQRQNTNITLQGDSAQELADEVHRYYIT